MSLDAETDVAVIGAGSIGIAVAYYLARNHGVRDIALVDPLDPMSLTSAVSGENYRNWWPHPVMTAFTDFGIDLLEELDLLSGGRLNVTRRGYALATRRESPGELIDDLYRGYGAESGQIRIHERDTGNYRLATGDSWTEGPSGVDVLMDRSLIRKIFPSFGEDLATVIHIRRAGSISAQQLGQFMLETIRNAGGKLIRGKVESITSGPPFELELCAADGAKRLGARRIVNAAGPFLQDIGRLLGEEIPVKCVFQQKIAFEDREAAIPRGMPFSIDLDPQHLFWSDEDSALLAAEPSTRHLLESMPGGVHCRPDGAAGGRWIKLGWAFNRLPSDPHHDAPTDEQFPDTVLRGASRLNPRLASYIGHLPRAMHHYGGYYTMTEENWPLIGPMKTAGAFIAGALSGFGSMAACSTGSICAAWVARAPVPDYAHFLTAARYSDAALMTELAGLGNGTL